MPELPEVETVRRSLLGLVGQKLQSAKISDGKLRYPLRKADLAPFWGKTLLAIERLGKYLIFRFGKANEEILVFHLGMTGRLLLNIPSHRYCKAEFSFTCDRLALIDVRRFAFVLSKKRAVGALPKGIDALADWPDLIAKKFRRRQAAIKNVLMDQNLICGIGNIYAAEILFAAGIHPARRASSLADSEIRQLRRAVKTVLKKAIAAKGTSISDFVYALPGEAAFSTGSYQNAFLVYARTGKPCRRCRKPIERLVLQNRATFFCPRCQK
ncbi:MAG: bifunctional DNA-formamidopyrimidine glycosylase/DNA-(apurinic or apyrimidinic site) lyase [Leptospiraceae bacterium]|nr:bifunctional DNA-formamidopyrimidine glycosylase/DNA-(apurinic or apyrimidinic site) lyase [Leptospiraceae bacterium]